MPNRGRLWAAVLAAITALALLVGCSAHSARHGGSEQPDLGSYPRITNDTQITLPLDAYLTSNSQAMEGFQAVAILVQRCMARHGFDYNPGTPIQPSEVIHRYFEPVDPATASQVGYHLRPLPNMPGGTGMTTPTAAERAVLVGSSAPAQAGQPAGGCFGEAEAQLEVGAPASKLTDGSVQQMQNNAYFDTMKDSRMRAVVAKWSLCMAQSGYHFSTLDQASDSTLAHQPTASRAEITQAVTDVKCKQKTDLVSVGYGLIAAYERQQIDANSQQLNLLAKQQQVEAELAAKVIAESNSRGPSPTPTN